jgi:hypothetical protein
MFQEMLFTHGLREGDKMVPKDKDLVSVAMA